jgi:phage FluMu protein Com
MNSKCPNCQKSGFEISTESPSNSNFKVTFVRCTSCKTVVGTLEPESTTSLLHKIAKGLNIRLD